MSQTWTDDTYASGHVAATDLQNIENNFACLKSSFSGASAPANPVAGIAWHDTSNNLLKMYYSGAWVTVYDLANNYAITARDCSRSVVAGTGLTGGGALTGNVTLNHGSHTGDVSGTGTLTIANNTITPAKTSHGFAQIACIDPTQFTVQSGNDTGYTTKWTCKIKMPSGPTAIRLYAYIATNEAITTTTSCRLNVGGQVSTAGTSNQGTYGWIDCNTVNVSGLTPGTVYDISVQLKISNGSYNYLFDGLAIWWE